MAERPPAAAPSTASLARLRAGFQRAVDEERRRLARALHCAPEKQGQALLNGGGHTLHQALARYNDGKSWALHYVTAREMYNVALAAMEGKAGDPAQYFDYKLPRPPVAT